MLLVVQLQIFCTADLSLLVIKMVVNLRIQLFVGTNGTLVVVDFISFEINAFSIDTALLVVQGGAVYVGLLTGNDFTLAVVNV